MPCLCPRPERGSTTAASPGSARWMAMPLELAPGAAELGPSGIAIHLSELERLFDARAQVETRRPGCGILRQRIAQPRVEDFYVESLQTKSRLAQWQHLRDVRYQLPRQHDL